MTITNYIKNCDRVIPRWGMERKKIMNSFFGISVDLYNKKEHIIYCIGGAGEFFANRNKEMIISKERPLGGFLFDFADMPQERENVADDYLSHFPDAEKKCLLTDKFFDAQRQLSFSPLRFRAYDVFHEWLPEFCNSICDMRQFYLEDKLYLAAEYDLEGLFLIYLDTIYRAKLFPHKCKCGNLFLTDKRRGGFTCPACIKNNNVEKLLRYKKKHNDEYEAQYIKVYQRWYTRIRRAKEKGQLTGDKLQLCDDIFSNFTSESYEKRNAVRSGEISPEAFFQWINEFDNRMNIANDRNE